MGRARALALLAVALVVVCLSALVLRPPSAGQPAATRVAPRALYVYGHSWTTGYGLSDHTKAYARLVAARLHETLHDRGVNGTLVHQVVEHLYGTGAGSWHAGARGDVVIQAVSNTARDHGIDRLSLATTRNALRVMLATVGARRRVEDSAPSQHYSGRWRVVAMPVASGGSVHVTDTDGASVRFTATGGEYVALRGVPGDGVRAHVTDLTAGRSVAVVDTGHQVHPAYSHAGMPIVFRLPRSTAGHTVAITKRSGTGPLSFDARLPQQRHPDPVVLVKEPYLPDYSVSTAHPYGSDRVMDAFNDVIDEVAADFPHARVVDPEAAGWDPRTMVVPGTTHATLAAHRFLAHLIEQALRG